LKRQEEILKRKAERSVKLKNNLMVSTVRLCRKNLWPITQWNVAFALL